MKYLIVIDMQNDFTHDALRNEDAIAIIPNVVEKVKNFDGQVIFTKDTHDENYMSTIEGQNLPVPHCILGTHGWNIVDELKPYSNFAFNKDTFGCTSLGGYLKYNHERCEKIDSVEIVGVCTDICVISNALLIKAFLPDVEITVDATCCAGVTKESHENALKAMEACHIKVVR